ncbi:rRNA maturation RNase YbeY [Limosilactobacillus fastidiosus]|uniref:Endoribonuclease YbeY n=1 Tax=Limosilactobacillus fastidiosus TaxID=2759855 RepID=A0A7W3U036_9LACO|nr:rRNA maturation RNase YbeY [Limosilactobacillus fastidiosus]MBB1062783.1 rRNA maturation RNase YbeY [Limosilactobacillus fastidiosus]MBB1086482.1 rRNA maturation RNase YbeY [Limosilactobacillus fastidiosus]MCD7084804.1 rRNA maturation RNase YbeY [Limosilactobacillus fastidiosus]MCD7085166.1 rRNA maturation RNase YbeY [Limosilactobacillus fastidiosus]MCD7115070.1 rRNA maturation RNase YbeY [Limosilactobacillus fastidiosus]
MELEIYDHTKEKVSSVHLELIKNLLDFAGEKLEVADNTEISVTLVNNPEIRELNSQYRHVDRATDVLSFAAEESGDETPIIMAPELAAELPVNLGDLFISVDKVAEQAKFLGHSFERELGFLVVHGFLHLNGYDHEQPEDEKKMFSLQREILDQYGLER